MVEVLKATLSQLRCRFDCPLTSINEMKRSQGYQYSQDREKGLYSGAAKGQNEKSCKRLTPAREGLSFLVFPASKLNATNSRIRSAVPFGLRNSDGFPAEGRAMPSRTIP